MHQNTIGVAKIVKRHAATFPSRLARYFDFTPWGGGYAKVDNVGSGAIVLRDGVCADIQTGRVYKDSRFAG
jgi:hypothetical protein